MLARSLSAGLVGIDSFVVTVEIDIIRGLPGFTIVGLPDSTIRESKDRIRSAVENSGYDFPPKNYIANLAPAFFKKQGSSFDLAVSLAILNATGQISADLSGFPAVGELSLDGSVRPVRGVISMVIALERAGFRRVLVPRGNAHEAAAVGGIDVFAVDSLREAVSAIGGKILPCETKNQNAEETIHYWDFSTVCGLETVRRAVEIAAAGFHNIVLYGPPGAGKSMIARSVPSILPPLTREQSIETTMIHSAGGAMQPGGSLITIPPFRSPHHTSSDVALVGGGRIPSVGEISLAHNGVLFMDEFSEFRHNVLQTLRQPMEDRMITVSRANGTVQFPCDFMLIAASNPCRCGYRFDPGKECNCTQNEIAKYKRSLSGPIIDRFDMEIFVPRTGVSDLLGKAASESSASIRKRVERARKIQYSRFSGSRVRVNGRMGSSDVKRFGSLSNEGTTLLEQASEKGYLSARSVVRVMRVARTIADLGGSSSVETDHVAEALSYKGLAGRFV